MKKAILIGSGVAGMATAARLASQGWRVEVFEANTHVGGKLSECGNELYRFDAGPSLFTLPQLLDQCIRDCGREPRDYYDYYKKEVACKYFWEDGTELTAYGNRQKFAREVEQKLGVASADTLSYLDHSAYVYENTSPVFLEKSLHKVSTYLDVNTLKSLSRIYKLNLTGTLHGYNHKRLKHPKLVQLFDRFATYNGSSPYLTPGVMNSIAHLEHNVGTYYPRGGMVQIARALQNLGESLGVRYHFGAPVEEIVQEGNRATGVRTAKGFFATDLVVSNMDVVPTYRKLLPQAKAPEKTLRQPRSSSALIFYWGIGKKFPQLDLHNIFFSSDYRREFEQIFGAQQVCEDPTIYINISSKEEPQDATPYGENWFVMINVPGDTGQDWDRLIESVRKNTLAKLSRRLNCKIEKLIEYEEILDPRSIEAKTSSYQGSLYGASSNNAIAAFLRHPNFSRTLQQLYFCGGSVHPGGGIPLCLLSAKITSDIIAKDYARKQ